MSDEGYEKQFIKEAFDTNWIAPLGENVDLFEKELTNKVGIDYGLALSSGTRAIHLAMKAAGVKDGDIVLCQDLTFSASVNPILYERAIPVFIDSEKDTWNIDPLLLEEALKKYDAKAVVCVNLYGISSKLDIIREICDRYGVTLIEDAAESLGTIYKNKWAGTYGDFGIYSFNGNKIITTSGGGILVSNHKEAMDKARYWSTQAREQVRYYEHKDVGYNYRLSNICAGIGRGQLKVLDQRIEEKRRIFKYYQEAFKDIDDIFMISEKEDERANYWLSTIILNSDEVRPMDIINVLEENNIEARPIWKPMHMQPVFKKYDFISNNEYEDGQSGYFFENGVCLPSDTNMVREDMERIVKIIKSLWK